MNYDAWSIYYDRINTPYNIDIKKIFGNIVANDLHIPQIFIIRILKQNYPFSSIFEKIINEDTLQYKYLEFPLYMIWSQNLKIIDVANDIIAGWGNKKNNKINKYIFITPNNIEYENKDKKNIIMITCNKNEENNDNIVNINYNDYLIDDVNMLENKIIEYDKKSNWHSVATGESSINEHMFFQLNMFIEALNIHNVHYGCLKFLVDFSEKIDYLEQRLLFFDINNER
ncbi:MAG: hypothetical protein FWG89_01490 [Treponema sp.]|nr:hypothetical protein [Treponema sp.]